jgi:hypothetical protein
VATGIPLSLGLGLGLWLGVGLGVGATDVVTVAGGPSLVGCPPAPHPARTTRAQVAARATANDRGEPTGRAYERILNLSLPASRD